MKQQLIFTLLVSVLPFVAGQDSAAAPTQAEVKAITKRVADWQIKSFDKHNIYRALSTESLARLERRGAEYSPKYHDLTWHMGALYTGIDQWRTIADDPTVYNNFLIMIGERNGWKLHNRRYHADDHTVGQFYLSLYEEFNNPAMLNPVQKQFDWILANPKTGSIEFCGYQKPYTTDCHDRWGWCDALFMAPPVWARLAKVTGEQKYLDFMDQEYHTTYDLLWDQEDRLFWRDSTYFPKREANGRKLYWARGNGWVFGGLALMIPELPEDWEGRSFYIDLFKTMANSLKECQREDGTWSMGLLGGVEGYPIKETSGTSFFTFGLAWGINNGLLDRATYEPMVYKAWNALTECVTEEGLLGFVQPVGAAPGDSYADKTEVYGIGAFLAAGTEVYKLVAKVPASGKSSKQAVTTFMEDGGWCWYQDPRAIIHNGRLFMGTVKGNGSGPALVGIYDLAEQKPLGTVLMQDQFDRDDHNAPVFYARPDGSVLATYAKHHRNPFHYSRISDPSDPLKWSEEFKHERTSPKQGDKVTYMNLYELKNEGKLYNFYRGINFNPSFVTSSDHGKTWTDPVHFFKNEVGGRHRPYARYVGNGVDTIGVSITDAHPRNYGNSLYYFEFRTGNFYNVDGTLIKNLKADGPLLPSETEKIYTGSETQKKPEGFESVPNAAWTSSVAFDSQGNPHIGYTLYLSNTDHRYRIASWNGRKWNDREVAFAGKCLYTKESSYTGLITLDPTDPTRVAISSDVDPNTGRDLGGKHEIYFAKVGAHDTVSSVRWKAVTSDSEYRNLRPILVSGEGYKVLIWLNGPWNTYIDYDVDVVGMVLERP